MVGEGAAVALARFGADVVIADKNAESAERVADHLRMSTRTLARRLGAEGTSHKELLDGLPTTLMVCSSGEADLFA